MCSAKLVPNTPRLTTWVPHTTPRPTTLGHITPPHNTILHVTQLEKSSFDDIHAHIVAEMDRKAGLEGVMKLREDVDVIISHNSHSKKQIDLALKFIDWFSNRGDA